MQENTDQNNSEYGHFSRSTTLKTVNQTWKKNLGNMVFETEIIAGLILTFKKNL